MKGVILCGTSFSAVVFVVFVVSGCTAVVSIICCRILMASD